MSFLHKADREGKPSRKENRILTPFNRTVSAVQRGGALVCKGTKKIAQGLNNRLLLPLIGGVTRWIGWGAKIRTVLHEVRHARRTLGMDVAVMVLSSAVGSVLRRHQRDVKRLAFGAVPAVLTFALLIACGSFSQTTFALEVVQSGTSLGYIADGSVLEEAAARANDQLPGTTEAINADASISVRLVPTDQLSDADALSEKLLANSCEVLQDGYGLYIDGSYYGCAREERLIRNTLEEIRQSAAAAVENSISATFAAQVEIKKGTYALQTEVTAEELKERLTQSVLPIEVKQKVVKEVSIPYRTVTTKDSRKEATYSRTVVKGQNGVKVITYEVVLSNGQETARSEVSSTVTKEPIARQITVGTKPVSSSSKLVYPIHQSKNFISSYFGDNRGHKGIDMAGPCGREVYAAANGEVASVNSCGTGYGLHLLIRHDDGVLSTVYAHCQELLVSRGERVTAGQVIALSGNSGRSSGPHLHFEVRKNGVPVNPAPYLGIS